MSRGFGRVLMVTALVGSLGAGTLGTGTAMAEPGGCLKYGAVGAVGGHLAHHGVAGAVGGCAVGMYKRHEYRKQQREAAREQAEAARQGSPDVH